MEINKNEFVKQIHQCNADNCSKNNTQKHIGEINGKASSLEAMSSYGKAQIGLSFCGNLNSKREALCEKINRLTSKYEAEWSGSEDGKNDFISALISLKDTVSDIFDEDVIDSLTNCYLLNTYTGDTLVKLLDKTRYPKISEKDLIKIFEYTTANNNDVLNKLLDCQETNGEYRFGGNILAVIVQSYTPEKSEILETLLNEKVENNHYRFNENEIYTLYRRTTPETKQVLEKLIADTNPNGMYRFTEDDIGLIMLSVNPKNVDFALAVIESKGADNKYRLSKNMLVSLFTNEGHELLDSELLKNYTQTDIQNAQKRLDEQEAIMFKNPQLYVNGLFDSNKQMQNEISWFLSKNFVSLMIFSLIYSKEDINNLMGMRFNDAEDYLNKLKIINQKNGLNLLKDLISSKDKDGKPFNSSTKIAFIDILSCYFNNNIDTSLISEMIKNERVDVEEIETDLLSKILEKCGLSEEELNKISLEDLKKWDIRYIHFLAQEVNSSKELKDLIKAACLLNIKDYISDETNPYGLVNKKTQTAYTQAGIDYNKWLNPNPAYNKHFEAINKNTQQLKQICEQLAEDIETLRKTPAKSFVDKQLSKYIFDNEFYIPNENYTSKAKLAEFLSSIIKQLDPVFKRAEMNIDNPQKSNNARNTLTIKAHLLEHYESALQADENNKKAKAMNLTIKMWDRFPQKDLFQGNYSTCCIGMGRGNGSAMTHYLLNTAFNMIELVDNNTGKPIGNALCYFVTDKNGKPAFVIDNIEIKNSEIPSEEAGIKLRNSITEYASSFVKDVTGNNDIPIYMSSKYNDVPCKDLKPVTEEFCLLGDTDCKEIYMDAYLGWTDKDDYKKSLNLLQLK